MSFVWINGQLVDKSEAKISVFDHGFLYGDGVWEHFRAFNGKLFRPEAALEILFASVRQLGIDLQQSPCELRIAIEHTLRANNRSDGYIRVIVTRGAGTLGPDPRKLELQTIIIAEEYQPFPKEIYEHGLHVAITQHDLTPELVPFRILGQAHLAAVKSVALSQGFLEAVLASPQLIIKGCTEGGLYYVRDGVLWPIYSFPHDLTWAFVQEVATLEGVVQATRDETEIAVHYESIIAADELLLAGTACGIIAVVKVGDRIIGTGREGPITKRIREGYRKLTRGEA